MTDKAFKNKVKSSINNGDLEALQQLCEPPGSVDPNLRLTGSGKTALMLAAREGHLRIVWFLVGRGADVLLQDDEGRSALMRACEGGHLEIVIYLVHRGSDVLQWNVWGRTPLLIAAFFGHWHVVQFMVSHGTSFSASSIDGKTALHIAIERDFTRVVSLLVDYGFSVHDRSASGESAIQLAAVHNNLDIVDILVEKGADKTEGLCAACAAGNLPMVKHLVALGADCNAPDAKGWTPVMHCCAADHMVTVAFMVSAGALLGAENRDGVSALGLASGACKAHLEGGVEAGAINALEERLTWALRYDSAEAVMAVLREGGWTADGPVDGEGHSLSFRAAAEGRLDVLSEIVLTKKKHSVLLLASQRGHQSVVEQLIRRGADLAAQDASGRTCLMLAAQGGHVGTAAALAAAGAAVDATDRDGWSALFHASRAGSLGTVRLLVSHGAALDTLDTHGKAAIFYADKEKHYDVVSYLFSMRARKALSIVGKYLSSKDPAVLDVGLSCLEGILPHGADEGSPWLAPSAAAAVLCSDDVVDALQRVARGGPPQAAARAESLLLVSARYEEYDIFSAIASENWSLVLEIAEHDGASMRDRSERLPLHHLLSEAGGPSDPAGAVVERLLALWPQAAAAADPVAARLPLVSAVLLNLPSGVISALVVAHPPGVDAVRQLPPDEQSRFWTTNFSLEALSAGGHRLWLTMAQLGDVEYADYFVQRALSNFPQLVFAVDSKGRSAYELAAPKNKYVMQPYLLWHGRYAIMSDLPEHASDSSVVLMAYDTLTLDEAGAGTKVALKLMRHKSAFEAELAARRLGLDPQYVLPVLAAYPEPETDLSGHPAEMDLSLSSDKAVCKQRGEALYTVVMPWAERNMYVSLKQERVGGRCSAESREVFRQLASALRHVHSKAALHGEVQPLNLLRSGRCWRLGDLDGCCAVGSPMTLLKASSAYLPPEAIHVDAQSKFACVKSQKNKELHDQSYDLLLAHPSFDMWGLGCVLYHMCSSTVTPLFAADRDDNLPTDGGADAGADSLHALAAWSDGFKAGKLARIEDRCAANLVAQLLSRDPSRRPSAERVLNHPFLSGRSGVTRMAGEEPAFDVFIAHKGQSDLEHALLLRDKLVKCGLRVWCAERLVAAAADVDERACAALMQSRTFVCLLSRSALEGAASLGADSPAHPLLLQCRVALELRQLGLLAEVFPLLVGDKITVNGASAEVYGKFHESRCLPEAPDVCVYSIEAKAAHFLESESLGPPLRERLTVSALLREAVGSAATLVEGDSSSAWDGAIDRISSALVSEQPPGGDSSSTTSATSMTGPEHSATDSPARPAPALHCVAASDASSQTESASPERELMLISADKTMGELAVLAARNAALEEELRAAKNSGRSFAAAAGGLCLLLCVSTFVLFKKYK